MVMADRLMIKPRPNLFSGFTFTLFVRETEKYKSENGIKNSTSIPLADCTCSAAIESLKMQVCFLSLQYPLRSALVIECIKNRNH